MGVEGLELKWPNDVLLAGQKLAGVLLEISGETNGPCEVVIGTGINIRCPEASAIAIDQPWTDLESSLGHCVPRNRLAASLLAHLIDTARTYDDRGFEAFRAEWLAADAYSGREVLLKTPADDVAGRMQGVAENGALILALPNGEQKQFHGGEVSLRSAAEMAVNG